MAKLKLDWCSHDAARHAVMRWHYSRAMPAAKLVRIGVWEDKRFAGVILYGSGANRHIARPYGLKSTEVCELVRVALAPGREHPTSKCLAISLRMVKRQSPGLKLIVSYADTKEGHLGTIYQATNWIYLGGSTQPYLKIKGQIVHPRTVYEWYGKGGQKIEWLRANVDPNAERIAMKPKLKYVYVFDKALRAELARQAKPYLKDDLKEPRAGSIAGDALTDQVREGGSIPTSALHSSLSA